ncbi:hypothetical protein [Embleya sp. NPDC059237]|uniref:hypothetical protein n=1 Tax=Embleya sp. NPDC059237 TaxID=3346784 RepID=UPI00369FA4FC
MAEIADIQMTGSLEVLAELETVSATLSSALRRIRYVEEGVPEPNDDIDKIHRDLLGVINQWTIMRAAMRRDLGQP